MKNRPTTEQGSSPPGVLPCRAGITIESRTTLQIRTRVDSRPEGGLLPIAPSLSRLPAALSTPLPPSAHLLGLAHEAARLASALRWLTR